MVKLFSDRWHTIEERDEEGINRIQIIRKYVISKYPPLRFFTAGILMIVFGVIALSLYFITKDVYSTYIWSVCFTVGVGLILGSLFKAQNEMANEFNKINEYVRLQCYSWLLGVYVGMRSIVRTDEQQKTDQTELNNISRVLLLSIDFSKLTGLVDTYKAIKANLDNVYYKFNFFNAGLDALGMIYTRSENIRKVIEDSNEKQRREFEETDSEQRRGVNSLVYFNNPIINNKFLHGLLKDIEDGYGLKTAISVKFLLENWFNKKIMLDRIETKDEE